MVRAMDQGSLSNRSVERAARLLSAFTLEQPTLTLTEPETTLMEPSA